MSGRIVDVPVLIAGGGPAGVTLAMELAYRGVRAIVIERRLRDESPNPRCNTTNARSMEIFRRLGCADAVRSAGLPAGFNADVVYMTRLNGEELTRYERSTTTDVRQGTMHGVASDWPTPEPQHFISQIYLEPALRDHARNAYDIDLREAWEFLHFEQSGDGVTVSARNLESGAGQTFHAQYLIGADGGGSEIRRAIGARLEGIPEVGNACSIFMEAPRLRELYDRVPGWMYRFSEGGVLVAIDGEDRWLLHLNRPPGMGFENFDPEPAMFAAIGEPFEYRVLNEVRWTARAMVANKYRDERVFLIGDAAHIWIPMGGFGMNAAVADATTLGWMLAGTIQGWLDPKVLDAYETERTPVGSLVAGQAVKWSRDLLFMRAGQFDADALDNDPQARADLGRRIRDVNLGEFECPGMQLGFYYANSPVIEYDGTQPPAFSLESYAETSWPGVRAPHVLREATNAPLFDEFGPGFSLLRIGAHPATGAALVAEAQRRGVPIVTIDVPESDAVRKYEGYDLVLVRPDGHVAFRSKGEPVDAKTIVDRVTGVLVPVRTVQTIQPARLDVTFEFGEGAHWHNGKLVFSDMLGERVLAYDPVSQTLATLAVVPGRPNGLAILADGTMLVASMNDRKIYALHDDGQLNEYADLSSIATGYLGDMAADAAGRIYIDDVGARVLHGEAPKPGRLILVDRDASARVVLDELLFPNGLAITPDGNTLLLAETQAGRVLQSRIDPKTGSLSDTRTFLDLEGDGCDGMAIDRAGGIWLCLPRSSGNVDRYDRSGRLTTRIDLRGMGKPIACTLNDDETALYIVGIEPLAGGSDIFGAMSRRETAGWLARADIPKAKPATRVRVPETVAGAVQ